MRKDRKKLRIRLVCYPQPFELVKDFTLARVNCIRISEFREDMKKGLIPDRVNTIIIPRGKYTFSFHTREIVGKKEIKGALLEQTKERYTKDLDKKYIFKTSRKDATFCFNTKQYMKQAKEENRLFLKEEKIYISNTLIYIFAKYLTAGKLGLSTRPDPNLVGQEQIDAENEKKYALLVAKLKNKCKESIANRLKEEKMKNHLQEQSL